MLSDKRRVTHKKGKNINVCESQEIAFWADHFGVTEEKLKEITSQVGTSVKAIEEHVSHLMIYYMSVMVS
jgi:Protein of unknown function (DUF3606)